LRPARHQRQPWPSWKKRTDSKKGPFFGRFGRKRGVSAQEKTFYFGFFLFFGDSLGGNPLIV
jgi:hypothetical protein